MKVNEQQVRDAIADQAGEWFVAHDAAPLETSEAAALAEWLKSSPLHVEQFLGVSVIARDLRELGRDPEFSVDALLAGARAEDDAVVHALRPGVSAPASDPPPRRWVGAALAMAAMVLVGVGLFSLWNAGLLAPGSAAGASAALHYETRHGEQMSLRLADDSVVHLNTDSAVTIRYGKGERLITLTAGEADFEVAHDPQRAFRVSAGSADVVAVGTLFDVRLDSDSTVVTVVEGRVAVAPRSSKSYRPITLQLAADQQLRVVEGAWPATPVDVDAHRATAWLRRQIVFDQEPLERVAAEFNRYGPKPIEIVTPELRNLQISGVFSTDDPDAFIAFLRSLKGVRVDVTPTRIRVSRPTGPGQRDYT